MEHANAATIDALLSAEGEEFVQSAYRALLGRDADPEGLGEYLEQLRSGVPKLSLLASLAQSQEAQRRSTGRQAFGAALAARIAREERPARSLAELLAFGDAAFVRAAYRLLLGREADAEGLGSYVTLLRAGEPKVDVLDALRGSEEGRARAARRDAGDANAALLAAIDGAVGRQRRARWPLVGALVAALTGAESYGEAARRQRRQENALHRVGEALRLRGIEEEFFESPETLATASEGGEPGDVRVSTGLEPSARLVTLPPAFGPRAAAEGTPSR